MILTILLNPLTKHLL